MAFIATSLGLQYKKEKKRVLTPETTTIDTAPRITITPQEENRCTVSANTRRDAETDKDLRTPIK